LLEHKIAEGETEGKANAVKLLWAWEGEKARPFLQGRLEQEKSKKVTKAIEEALASSLPASAAPQRLPELAPLPPIPSPAPLGSETEQAWEACFQKVNAAIAKMSASQTGRGHIIKPISPDVMKKAFASLQTGAGKDRLLEPLFPFSWQREVSDPIAEFWTRPELLLVHLIRFLHMVGGLRADMPEHHHILSYGNWVEKLLPAFRRTHPQIGLRELAATWGLDYKYMGRALLRSYWEIAAPFGLPPAQVWPYWAENLDLLEEAFAPASTGGFM